MSAEPSSSAVPVYQVRLINPALGLDRTLAVPANEYILDQALAAGIPLPHYCRIGCCSTCVSKLESGSVNQNDQCILNEPELAAQLVVICCALPTSDCTIRTHQQDLYRQLQPR
ncbi:MAG: 2Fe-2S iron-sulfur cluster-binding protein [Thermostichales cyanobacterium SRBZ-1_bins_19]